MWMFENLVEKMKSPIYRVNLDQSIKHQQSQDLSKKLEQPFKELIRAIAWDLKIYEWAFPKLRSS